MISLSPGQFLVLYLWFPLTALLFFLLLIARFYQKFSGEQTFFRLFLLPVTLFGAAAVRYASLDQVTGDGVGDALYALGGIVLLALCAVLYRRMVLQQEK